MLSFHCYLLFSPTNKNKTAIQKDGTNNRDYNPKIVKVKEKENQTDESFFCSNPTTRVPGITPGTLDGALFIELISLLWLLLLLAVRLLTFLLHKKQQPIQH